MTASLDLVLADAPDAATEPAWRIAAQQRVTSLDGIYRPELDPTRQFDVSGLAITDEDFSITVSQVSASVAEAGGGPTAIVLVGDGTMRFAPTLAADRGQLRVFDRREVLESPFRAAFIRLSPSDLDNHLARARLTPRAVGPRDLQLAQQVFAEEVDKSFSLDLSDFSRDAWSLVPTHGDFLAEVYTRRHGTLTYTRSAREAEDISLFNRRLRRNISVYASERKARERGPSYSEDDLAVYDVLDYMVEVSFRFSAGDDRIDADFRNHRTTTVVDGRPAAPTELQVGVHCDIRYQGEDEHAGGEMEISCSGGTDR